MPLYTGQGDACFQAKANHRSEHVPGCAPCAKALYKYPLQLHDRVFVVIPGRGCYLASGFSGDWNDREARLLRTHCVPDRGGLRLSGTIHRPRPSACRPNAAARGYASAMLRSRAAATMLPNGRGPGERLLQVKSRAGGWGARTLRAFPIRSSSIGQTGLRPLRRTWGISR